jgi:hypothetical protein
LHGIVAKSQLNVQAVKVFQLFQVGGIEYLVLHLAGEVIAVLNSSQVVIAEWV